MRGAVRGRRSLLVALAVVLAGCLAVVGAPAANAKTCATFDPAKYQASQRRPVIFVHGWTGSPMTATADAVKAKVSIQPFVFNYHSDSTTWANSDDIAGCLTKAIRGVSDAYSAVGGDGKVIVVAHSMGGLATLYAAEAPDISGRLAAVITLSTPFLGSPLGSHWGAAFWQGVNEFLPAVNVPPGGSNAQECLALHTDGAPIPAPCTQPLPQPLPPSVHLTLIGGDATVRRRLFWQTLYSYSMGSDGIVSANSAQGYPHVWASPVHSDDLQVLTVPCNVNTDTLLAFTAQLGGLSNLFDFGVLTAGGSDHEQPNAELATLGVVVAKTADCGHNHIATNPQAVDLVAKAIQDEEARIAAIHHSLSPFVGRWTQHAGELVIRSDGSGSLTWQDTLHTLALVPEFPALSLRVTANSATTATAVVTGSDTPRYYPVGYTFNVTRTTIGLAVSGTEAWCDDPHFAAGDCGA